MTATNAERQARHRKVRALAGHKTVTVTLTPEAARSLEAWRGSGISVAKTINRLLETNQPFTFTGSSP